MRTEAESQYTAPPPTGPYPTGRRIVAALLDIFALSILLAVMFALFGEKESNDQGVTFSLSGAPFLIFIGLALAYYAILERATGRTIGKELLGIRVVRADGAPIGWRESLARNLIRVVDGLPVFYLVGLVAVAASRHDQRLGDMAAGTVVIREPRPWD